MTVISQRLLKLADSIQNPKATVRHFLNILSGTLTRLDEKETKKELKRKLSPNIYRLSLLLEAKQRVEKEMRQYLDDNSEEAMEALKNSMQNHFYVDSYPDLRNFMKQVDAWVIDKKIPKYAESDPARQLSRITDFRDVSFLQEEAEDDPRVVVALKLLGVLMSDIKNHGEKAILNFRKEYLKQTGGGYFDTVVREAIARIYTDIADKHGLKNEAYEHWH